MNIEWFLAKLRGFLRRWLGVESDYNQFVAHIQDTLEADNTLNERMRIVIGIVQQQEALTHQTLLAVRNIHARLRFYEQHSAPIQYLALKLAREIERAEAAKNAKPVPPTDEEIAEGREVSESMRIMHELHEDRLMALPLSRGNGARS